MPERILIVGLGKTGVGAAKFLAARGKRIAITDSKSAEALSGSLKELEGVEFTPHFGGHDPEVFLSYPLIVVSPGVDVRAPHFRQARDKGIDVIGEMELASRFVREPIIAVTGTNGKTTTTTLIGEIFEKVYPGCFVGGNIGNPFINYVQSGKTAPCVILEVSSFQLETIETFHPHTALLLNITEDHLDRYDGYGDYIEAKYRIFENQHEGDHAILRRGLGEDTRIKAQKFFFSAESAVKEGAFLKDGVMHVRVKGSEFLYKRDSSPLPGVHNTENLLAALIAAHLYGIKQEAIEEVVRGFRGLSHRVEPVRTVKGVTFYNDSKATNVDATKRALEGMETGVVLIAGGRDKGGSYRVIGEFADKIRAMVLIGEAQEKIAGDLEGVIDIYREKDLQGAVEAALSLAKEGDSVLFSPMCSSFDMFRDYKERGNIFKEIVGSL